MDTLEERGISLQNIRKWGAANLPKQRRDPSLEIRDTMKDKLEKIRNFEHSGGGSRSKPHIPSRTQAKPRDFKFRFESFIFQA